MITRHRVNLRLRSAVQYQRFLASGGGKVTTTTSLDEEVAPQQQPPTALNSTAASRMTALAWNERHKLGAGMLLSSVSAGLSLVFPRALGLMLDRSLDQPVISGTAVVPPATTTSAPSLPTMPVDMPTMPVGVVDISTSFFDTVTSLPPEAMAAGLFGVAVAQSGISVARTRLLTSAGEGIACKIREQALSNLLRQELAFFDREASTYNLISFEEEGPLPHSSLMWFDTSSSFSSFH
jgi:ABC-type multidrug transport system fused ATPase/permease subunit